MFSPEVLIRQSGIPLLYQVGTFLVVDFGNTLFQLVQFSRSNAMAITRRTT